MALDPRGGGEGTWASEKAMQLAIRDNENCWRRFGFPSRPIDERPVPGTRDRIDLFSPGIIAECKLHADTRALAQVDRYVAQLRRHGDHTPTGHWHGLIVTARTWTRELAAAVAAREDVQLILCAPDEHHRPLFVEIPDEGFNLFDRDLELTDLLGMLAIGFDDVADLGAALRAARRGPRPEHDQEHAQPAAVDLPPSREPR